MIIVNYSKELNEIFREAFKLVEEKKGQTIPLSLVTFLILKRYLKDWQGEDEFLKSYLMYTLDENTAEDMIKDIEKLVMEEIMNNPDKPEYVSIPFSTHFSSIPVDSEFGEAMERSRKQDELYFKAGPKDPVSTAAFFLAVCWGCGDFDLEEILEDYGITKNTYMDYLSQSFDLSKMKRKTFPGEVVSEDLLKSSTTPKNSKPGEDDDMFEEAGKRYSVNSKSTNPDSETPYLDLYSYDMTDAARLGKYDPVVGRLSEIRQMTEILCCRKKNNVVLLGDPGCGKTAVVELLAQKITQGDVPIQLKDKRICSLDLNALVSGTKYRGEYEQRLQGIIQEVCDNPNIIVYIDEFHNLVGNGGSAGNGDGANILKPYLARGEFQCIGSTTLDEYRKWVEKDGALKRRFQNVTVDEPSAEETTSILEGLAKKYEKYHRVRYDKDVLKACVDWSGRYINDRFFPDKAIDCMDMAGSLAKLENIDTTPSPLELLKQQLEEVRQKKTNAMIENRFDDGLKLKEKENEIESKIRVEEKKSGSEKDRKNWPKVTIKEVADVISKISKVPVDKISESETEKIRDMKQSLEKKVIGQDLAVTRITTALQRNFLGLRDPQKPIASLLLVGPTGTGKTLICKEMAKEFFGSEKALIKFDMAEFSEHHEVTKLTGSTASYVGYDDAPLLEQVRRQPYSVVLFDEIEKAAPEIYNIFLSILDEGTVALGNGQRVDFKNCIIVFTGNVGTKELALTGKGLGFGGKTEGEMKKTQEKIVMKAVEKHFRPEFINRLTNITVFNELHQPEMMKIFDLEIAKLKERLRSSGYSLTVDKKVKELCVSQCDPKYGARDLNRSITRNIEDVLCQAILDTPTDLQSRKISVVLGKEKDTTRVEFKLPAKKKTTPAIEPTEETPALETSVEE